MPYFLFLFILLFVISFILFYVTSYNIFKMFNFKISILKYKYILYIYLKKNKKQTNKKKKKKKKKQKKKRTKRLAPVLIKEITRRVNLSNRWQAVYTAGVVLPKPVSKCRYNHRTLNPKKLVDVYLFFYFYYYYY
jgi:hypothetical protein